MQEMNNNQNHTQVFESTAPEPLTQPRVITYESLQDEDDLAALLETLTIPGSTRSDEHAARRKPRAHQGLVYLAQSLVLTGAGGTARKVFTLFKVKVMKRFGVMPVNLVILVFDSGSERVVIRDSQLGEVELEPGREYINFGQVPIAGIKRRPEFHPEMTTRLKDAFPHIYQTMLAHGAGQIRAQGLIYLYYHIPQVIEAVQHALRRAVQRTTDLERTLDQMDGMNVVLVSSTGGGQGSGILLDLAAIVREELRNVSGATTTSRVIGCLAFPSAFGDLPSQAAGRNIILNHTAFVKDTNLLMANPELQIAYNSLHRVDVNEPPFDQIFIFEGVDENGHAWPTTEGLFEMMADVLLHLFCDDVGREERAYAVNGWNFHQAGAKGYGDYMGTAGLAELRFPGGQIAAHNSIRHAGRVLDLVLAQDGDISLPSLPKPDVKRMQRALMDEHADIGSFFTPPSHLRHAAAGEIVDLARDQVAHLLHRRVYGGAFAQIHQLATALNNKMMGEREAWFHQAAASGNVPATVEALRRARADLRAACDVVAPLREEDEQAATGHGEAMELLDKALEEAANGIWGLRHRQTLATAHRYFRAAQSRAEGEIAALLLNQVEKILHNLLQEVEAKLQRVERTGVRIRQLRERLRMVEKQVSEYPAGHNVVMLVDEVLVDEVYRKYAPTPTAILAELLEHPTTPLWQWGEHSMQDAVRTLLHTIAPHFAPTTQVSIEKVLKEHWPERSPEQWVTILANLAAGAWNPDPAVLPRGSTALAEYMTLGVPDHNHSMFAGGNRTVMDTGDSRRIVALRTIYGGRVDALKATAEWERVYEKLLPITFPSPHIFPQLSQDNKRVEELFTAGLCFGFIEQRVNFYHFVPEDTLASPVQLGNGFKNSLDALAADAATLHALRARVDDLIERLGKDAVRSQLLDFIAGKSDRTDELWLGLLRTARTYADNL